MFRVLAFLALLFLIVYAVLDVAQTDDDRDRLGLPKWLWVGLIILTSGGAALVWLIVKYFINPKRDQPPTPRQGPVAPDDDPDFLWRLQQQVRRERDEDSGSGPDTVQ